MIKQMSTEYIQFLKQTWNGVKFLLLQFGVIALYLIFLALFSNQFALEELTYINAVLMFYFFGEILSIGINTSTAVFMNQNINSLSKVRKYLKIGGILTILIGLFYIALLFSLKDVIFTYVVPVVVVDHYVLFYAMLPAILLHIITQYWMGMIRDLQKYSTYVKVTLIRSLFVVALFSGVWLFTIPTMYVIPIILLLSSILSWIYLEFQFQTKKIIEEHMTTFSLTFKNLKNSFKDGISIIIMSGKDIIWNINTLLIGLFLLKSSELIYNAYYYFENVFDIFNSLYFSFAQVINIMICISLGSKKFNLAYQQGKYAMITIIWIWLIFFIISVIISPLMYLGMNADTVEIGKSMLYAYLFIQLLRFVDWGFGYYILVCGGKVKLVLLLEALTTVYYLSFILFGSKLFHDPSMLMIIVGIDSLVKAIVYFVYFKSKRWVKQIRD